MNTETEKKAYALGIIGREMGVDFDNDLTADQYKQINEISEDALSDEPKTEIGKSIKKLIAEEQANSESEYNKGFNFHKDLNENKINPSAVFVFQVLAKYADRLVAKDPNANGEMLSELIIKMNELELPTGYTTNVFNMVAAEVAKFNQALAGQVEHREDEIKALSDGVKHPKYGTLSPHLASFKQLDGAIEKLRNTFNFTEEDYRPKQ